MDDQIKKIKWGILLTLGLVFVAILAVDYLNIPSQIGISVRNVHLGTTGDLLNVLVVLGVFEFTFRVIDEREIKKDKNARSTALILMRATYVKCLETLSIMDNQSVLEKSIIPKIDGNELLSENKLELKLRNDPFEEYKSIVDLSENGVVRPYELENYLKIMNLFQGFITLRITFFDIGYAAWTEEQVAMKDKISTERIRLDQSLNGSIKKINNQLADIKY